MSISKSDITAVILAGGQGRRMGGQDKGLIDFNGQPLIRILVDKLCDQSVSILINANRNQQQYETYGYPVIGDQLENFQGPLAGFAAAMQMVNTQFILTLPCDSPLLIDDYVQRFITAQNQTDAPICVADDGERLQPVHALIRVDLLDSLQQFLHSGDRKIDRWYAQHNFAKTDFSDSVEMFRNINTPEDKQKLSEQQ
jgi:molybdenum cofactor guanylyltransferase